MASKVQARSAVADRETHLEIDALDHDPWPQRAVYLLVLGAALGLAFDALVGDPQRGWTGDVLRISAAFAIFAGGAVFALTLERLRWLWSVAFALAAGLVVGSVFFWNGSPAGWRSEQGWQLVAALLAIVIAAPLFQSSRDAGRWRPDYVPVHVYSWGNLILWGAAWAFVLIVYLLAQLLAELFSLIGIDLLREALRKSWFTSMLIGAAVGAAFGLLRDRDKMLGLLQRVVMTVLSVLTPILAAGLLLFVLALPFTGLAPLWEQTKSTTPILLVCVIGAFVLANATLGRSREEESKQPLLRYSAVALGAVMLPLAVVAAVSTWLRIDQYGFTPARLWSLVFVAVCLAVALAYFASLVIGRLQWSDRVRRSNMRLAIGICGLALLLATPLIDFGAISTRDQLARLQNGKVSPEQFDWAALRFDFGPAGERAARRLARNGPSLPIRNMAQRVVDQKSRYDAEMSQEIGAEAALSPRAIAVRPVQAEVPPALRELILQDPIEGGGTCSGKGECILFWRPGEKTAVAVHDGCAASVVGRQAQVAPEANCRIMVEAFRERQGNWEMASDEQRLPPEPNMSQAQVAESLRRERAALDSGEVEIREIRMRQVFLGGKPVSGRFE